MPRCPKCAYELSPFDTECPRCKRLAETPCALCGRTGASRICGLCQKEICEQCAAPTADGTLCRTCASQQQPAGQEPGPAPPAAYPGPPVKGGW